MRSHGPRLRLAVMGAATALCAVLALVLGLFTALSPGSVRENAAGALSSRLTGGENGLSVSLSAQTADETVLADEGPWLHAFGLLEVGSGTLSAADAAAAAVCGAAADSVTALRSDEGEDAGWQSTGLAGLARALGSVESAAKKAQAARSVAAAESDGAALEGAYETLASASVAAVDVPGASG